MASALVAVESRVSALAPSPAGANDLLWPIRDGLIEPDHISVELGELVLGVHPGRTSPDQLTLFKSVGVAVEDLAAASLVVKAARASASAARWTCEASRLGGGRCRVLEPLGVLRRWWARNDDPPATLEFFRQLLGRHATEQLF